MFGTTFLPAYYPDLTPIEAVFAKLKPAQRRAAAPAREAFDVAIAEALASVTSAELRHGFQHCGVHLPAQPM